MKKALLIILSGLCLYYSTMYAQDTTIKRCGYSLVEQAILARNPNYKTELKEKLAARQRMIAISRTTGIATPSNTSIVIPVVFHVILDSAQLQSIAGTVGVRDRAESQIAVLNVDYNRQNSDSIKIPSAFKPLYGNVGIKFGLAKIDPNGLATEGFDIHVVNAEGFEVSAQDGAGTAKHASSGGVDAWDPSRYVNVWVINPTGFSNVLGLTVAADYGFPQDEIGIVLNYMAFGKRTAPSQLFYAPYDHGRTLTHEVGHYLGLYHPWGDDNGLCPSDPGGQDDGIQDTPPEADATYGCPNFPHFDNCTSSGNGVMFMNYMDYVNDTCMDMFTRDQIIVMQNSVSSGGMAYSVTTHPELVNGNTAANNFIIYPNPVGHALNILFDQLPQNFNCAIIRDMLGRQVSFMSTAGISGNSYTVDVSSFAPGLYLLECYFGNNRTIKKFVRL